MPNFKNSVLSDLCQRVMTANNWNAYDVALQHQGMHVVCFQSKADTAEKKSILKTVVGEMHRNAVLERRFGEVGLVVFDRPGGPHMKSLVGVVAANPKVLEAQYAHARLILKAMGLCEGASKRLFLDSTQDLSVELKTVSNQSLSNVLSTKSTLESSVIPLLKGEISGATDRKRNQDNEITIKELVGFGAVRSAAIINMISHDMGVSNLNRLITLESRIKSDLQNESPASISRMEAELNDLEAEQDAVSNNLLKVMGSIYDRMKRRIESGGFDQAQLRDTERVMDCIISVSQDIHGKALSAGTYESVAIALDIAEDALEETWIKDGLSYCLHGLVLTSCMSHGVLALKDNIDTLKARVMEADLTTPIVSSSLGFWARVNKQPEGQREEKLRAPALGR